MPLSFFGKLVNQAAQTEGRYSSSIDYLTKVFVNNHLARMLVGICLVDVFFEFLYSIYQNTEFALSARTLGIYLVISTIFAIYKVALSKRTKLNQSEEPF